MQTKTKLKIVIAIIAGIFLLTAGGGLTYLLNRLFHLDDYKKEILTEVESGLGKPVSYDKGSFSLRYGPSFSFTNVKVGDPGREKPLLTTDRLTIKVALMPLLTGNIILKDLLLNHPSINIIRFSDGTLNAGKILSEDSGGGGPQVKGIKLKHAYVTFTDETIKGKLITTLEDLDLSLDGLRRGQKTSIKASTLVITEGGKGILSVSGSVQLPEPNEPLAATYLKGRVIAKNLDAAHFWPYYNTHVPFERISGRLGINAHIRGRLDTFTSKGSMTASSVSFSWPSVFHSTLSPREMYISYDMGVTRDDISVKTFDAVVDGIKVKGSFSFKDRQSNDPRIVAKAKTSPMPMSYVKPFIPFGVIPKDTSEFIEKKIPGGIYTIENGILDGHLSQILNMGIGNNFAVLSVTGKVKDGEVSWGGTTPTFSKIAGKLELTGKDFILKEISGYFGQSPFNLEGKIADFSRSHSTTYPFSAIFTPKESEVGWLAREIDSKKPVLTGASQLKITGTGSSADYHLTGNWDLTSTGYKYANLIAKPEKLQNQISFDSAITTEEIVISNLQYDCYPIAVNVNASYNFADKRFKIGIKSNEFLFQDAAQISPLLKSYQCRGRVSGAILGEGKTATPMAWKGKISLGNFAFKPAWSKPVTNMTGDIAFHGETMETSLLTGKVGSSLVSLKGSITNLAKPVLSVTFSSPAIDPADIGLHDVPPGMTVRKVQGELAYGDGTIQINSLSSQINGSAINVSGKVNIDSFGQPAIDLAISSPHVVIDDILPLMQMNQSSSTGSVKYFRAAITANEGSFREIPFKRLQSNLLYQNSTLTVENFLVSAFGGKISGAGVYDPTKGRPYYHLKVKANDLAISQIASALHTDHTMLLGTASFDGDVTATGESLPELKKSLGGEVAITIEKGSLRQFPVLSKVFSILNVSQLFKLQLPDMISGGMPFNRVNGHFVIKEGVASTSDFYVDSNAMNISIVGSADLAKSEIDLAIGLQPLQTVDKVVNHIPILGWVLTGKDRSLITAYFEAKGPWNDPVVNTYPVKSMARGVFDIFKRVFQLPAKLVTDTGEVITGR